MSNSNQRKRNDDESAAIAQLSEIFNEIEQAQTATSRALRKIGAIRLKAKSKAVREDLPALVSRLLKERDLSYRKVAIRSESSLTAGTVQRLVNRQYGSIEAKTLINLARGLGVSPMLLLQAVEFEVENGASRAANP